MRSEIEVVGLSGAPEEALVPPTPDGSSRVRFLPTTLLGLLE